MICTLKNIRKQLERGGLIQKERLYHSTDKLRRYKLLYPIEVKLSNGFNIIIPEGFKWDLSSVPRFLWGVFPPDGDFEMGALIHDFLYVNNMFNRKFADEEMLLWSNATNGTDTYNLKRLDNYLRFFAVRLFGWIVW